MAVHAPITGAPLRAPSIPIYDDLRASIEIAIERLISALDAIDGDPDVEPNGDELDGNANAEDAFIVTGFDLGAGCPIADPGGDPLDRGEVDDCDMEDDDAVGRRRHRDRFRQTRCHELRRAGWNGQSYNAGWQLKREPIVPRFSRLRARKGYRRGRR